MDFSWLHAPDSTTIQYGITTLILVISFICLRLVLVRLILKSPGIAAETRRRWVVTIRNVLVGIFIIGLISIWESQLSAFAVSLVAVALAVVLATDGVSETLIGLADPDAVVAALVEAGANRPPGLRSLEIARALVEAANEAHRENESGDNVAAGVISLIDL